jgi:hypothetical protein
VNVDLSNLKNWTLWGMQIRLFWIFHLKLYPLRDANSIIMDFSSQTASSEWCKFDYYGFFIPNCTLRAMEIRLLWIFHLKRYPLRDANWIILEFSSQTVPSEGCKLDYYGFFISNWTLWGMQIGFLCMFRLKLYPLKDADWIIIDFSSQTVPSEGCKLDYYGFFIPKYTISGKSFELDGHWNGRN